MIQSGNIENIVVAKLYQKVQWFCPCNMEVSGLKENKTGRELGKLSFAASLWWPCSAATVSHLLKEFKKKDWKTSIKLYVLLQIWIWYIFRQDLVYLLWEELATLMRWVVGKRKQSNKFNRYFHRMYMVWKMFKNNRHLAKRQLVHLHLTAL